MKTYKYGLDKSCPTRLFRCPECGKKSLKRYKDNQTGEYLSEEVGRCNREVKCGYHHTPKEYFGQNPQLVTKIRDDFDRKPMVVKPPSTFPFDLVAQSMKCYEKNYFVAYLHTLFSQATVEQQIQNYCIGTSKHWLGATIFWQIDATRQVRTGKVMLYNPQTGKRIKAPYNHIQWVHRVLKHENFELSQCFFGSHLLSQYPQKPVAIVESEKTAIIASGCVSECIWLATGGLSNLNAAKWQYLATHKVILYPDLGGYQTWQDKAAHLQKVSNLRLTVSDILEKEATEDDRRNGLDIADFLIREMPQKSVIF